MIFVLRMRGQDSGCAGKSKVLSAPRAALPRSAGRLLPASRLLGWRRNERDADTLEEDAARLSESSKLLFWLDEPKEWNLKVRRLRLTGWCVAKAGEPLVAIHAQLRGKIFLGTFDRERADVRAHLGLPQAALRCGFTIEVRVPYGRGRLEVRAARAEYEHGKRIQRP